MVRPVRSLPLPSPAFASRAASTPMLARSRLRALAVAGALAGAGCGAIPGSARDVLDHADTFEIYALEPYGAADGEGSFQGHPVLGSAKVTDPAAQQRILDIIDSGMGKWATQAKCFNPRHGVHAVRAGRTVDITICYQCSNIVIAEGSESKMVSTGDVRSDLDAEFGAFGVVPPAD